MSEYTATIVVCDRCHPDFLPGLTFFPLENIKGVLRGNREFAYSQGWEERDYGDACPECAAEDADDIPGTATGLKSFLEQLEEDDEES